MSAPLPILVVGSVALDTVTTPAGERRDLLGGAASFFALAASRYCPVRLVGVIGTDFPEEHRELFRRQGIDLEGLRAEPGRTFRWEGVYSADMNDRETRRTELNVFERFHPALPEAYRTTRWVFLANIEPRLQLEVLDQMDAPERVALDTMNFWIESSRDDLLRVLGRVDLLLINDAEARQLTGEFHLLRAARAIQELGPRVVVIKRGEHGTLSRIEDGWFALPAFPVETLKDPTGAGDAFAGGMLGHLCAAGGAFTDASLRRAVAHGTVVASHVVEAFGVEGLISLTSEGIARRLQKLWETCRFEPS